MKIYSLLSLLAALMMSACAGGHYSSGIKNVGVKTTPPKGIVVMAPDKANVFAAVAAERNGWLEAQLRTAINNQLAQSARFQPAKGAEDGVIVFSALRHGLIEVSANNYAAQLVAEITLTAKGGKAIGNREITSNSGDLHTLAEFEDSRTYETALAGAAEKLALELVNDL